MLDHKKQTGKMFYQNLGKLFYAVAQADHSVHVKEIDRLKKTVRESWLQVDAIVDEYGADAAFQIESVFDWLLEYEKNGEDCYEEFEAFYNDNKKMFSEKMKYLIMSTSRAIASAFSGRNKSELILLGRLELLFKG
ncbi:hypothetical protein DKG77_15215 [Flagellimonas aquimarina]|uniref:TerB family tellurite resistance protein n=1 Tax=Flagellimonas aquimarina TaxID=2201895 RepID=A0A316KVL6_9FLAO|nr:hypothetical protein [Allomuricauda koreensis]PWL37646.1 hypothetical protein DKG77_15215 [Allomuricauda koreensis]